MCVFARSRKRRIQKEEGDGEEKKTSVGPAKSPAGWVDVINLLFVCIYSSLGGEIRDAKRKETTRGC